MVVRGTTPKQRAEARKENTRQRRLTFYVGRIRDEAKTPRQQLAYACDFARAVGDDLDDAGRFRLAGAIAKLAEEANRP